MLNHLPVMFTVNSVKVHILVQLVFVYIRTINAYSPLIWVQLILLISAACTDLISYCKSMSDVWTLCKLMNDYVVPEALKNSGDFSCQLVFPYTPQHLHLEGWKLYLCGLVFVLFAFYGRYSWLKLSYFKFDLREVVLPADFGTCFETMYLTYLGVGLRWWVFCSRHLR